MFGCTFSQDAQLSVFNSKLYAGVTEEDAGNVAEDIRIDALWAALGGPQPWAGWGVSSPDAHLSNEAFPLNDVTGYLASRGYMVLGTTGAKDAVTLLGGAVLGGVVAVDASLSLQEHVGAPQGTPTLLRNDELIHVLNAFTSELNVVGGDRAVTLDETFGTNPTQAELYSNTSQLTWFGPWTQTITDGYCFLAAGGESRFVLGEGENIDFTLLANTFTSVGFSVNNGHTCLFEANAALGNTFSIHHGNTAATTIGVFASIGSSIGAEVGAVSIQLNQDLFVIGAQYIGVYALDQSNVTFESYTFDTPYGGVVAVWFLGDGWRLDRAELPVLGRRRERFRCCDHKYDPSPILAFRIEHSH